MKYNAETIPIFHGCLGIGDVWKGDIRLSTLIEYECALLCEKRAVKELPDGINSLEDQIRHALSNKIVQIMKTYCLDLDEERLNSQIEELLEKQMYLLGFDLKKITVNLARNGE